MHDRYTPSNLCVEAGGAKAQFFAGVATKASWRQVGRTALLLPLTLSRAGKVMSTLEKCDERYWT
jgi:hypothetical protein